MRIWGIQRSLLWLELNEQWHRNGSKSNQKSILKSDHVGLLQATKSFCVLSKVQWKAIENFKQKCENYVFER